MQQVRSFDSLINKMNLHLQYTNLNNKFYFSKHENEKNKT